MRALVAFALHSPDTQGTWAVRGRTHLLPHEGWLARTALQRQLNDSNETGKRLLPRYGADRFALLMAAYASRVPAGFLVLAGILGEVPDGLTKVSRWLLRVGFVFVAVGFVRYFQCARVARKFPPTTALLRPPTQQRPGHHRRAGASLFLANPRTVATVPIHR
jgi:hypothetical protein